MSDNQHAEGSEAEVLSVEIPKELLKDGKIAGKFPATAEGLKQFNDSYWNIVGQRKQTEAELATLRANQETTSRTSEKKEPALKRLAALGIPEDDLAEAIQEATAAFLGPAVMAAEARDRVSTTFPTFAKSAPEIFAWVNEDPERSALFNQMKSGSPEGAFQWATMQYERAHPAPSDGDGATKSAARLPNSGGGSGNRSAVETSVDQKQFSEAVEYFHETGDKDPVWAIGLANVKPWGAQ